MQKPENVRYENQYYRPHRAKKNNTAILVLFAVTVCLVAATIILAVLAFTKSEDEKTVPTTTPASGAASASVETDEQGETIVNTGIVVATSTPTPEVKIEPNQNPVLFPANSRMNVQIGTPDQKYTLSGRGGTQVVYNEADSVKDFQRETPIHFTDPLDYQSVPGILTFRGNNFRNCASWGYIEVDPAKDKHLEKLWEFDQVGSVKSSAWSFSWFGTGWTGQPLAVKWDYNVQQLMNMVPEKRAKQGLTEVIIAALDGNVYFFDLEDGQKTRDPIKVGATIKGTPCVDPRGYPLLYVGQGDNNGGNGIGFRIYNLLTGELMHFQNGMDSRAYRSNWGACDSSPIVCGEADTLIFPNENGMIYTVKLNTQFNAGTGVLTINPQTVAYKYAMDGQSGGQFGIESSMAVYDHYGWCTDNGGNLICIDLNTMSLVWSRRLDDDSDVTPVIEEDNGHVYLYTGTEVDWQKDIVGNYQGASFTYKFDAMTGEVVWQTSQDCWTKNAANSGDDVNGGMLGTPVVGKGPISNLVIFSYCMTKGTYRGDTIVAYDKSTGIEAWRYVVEWVPDAAHVTDPYSWSSPVDLYTKDGRAYILLCDSYAQVHLVDASNGQMVDSLYMERAKTAERHNVESSPIVVDGIMVVGTRGQSIFGVKIS